MSRELASVNVFQGADSTVHFSTGNTYPAVGVPWGMTYWSPQSDEGPWLYSRRPSHPAGVLQGFRATRQPSPWIRDWGQFTLLPFRGEPAGRFVDAASSCRLGEEAGSPDLYRVRLLRYQIGCEMTATCRCGVLRLDYDPAGETPEGAPRRLWVRLASQRCEAGLDATGHVVRGVGRKLHPDDAANASLADLAVYFVITANATITRTRDAPDGQGFIVEFDAKHDGPIELRVGTSAISCDQAQVNLDREVGDRGFDAVRQMTADKWARELSRIRLTEATERQRRTFYSCLYRVLLWPQTFHEIDEGGRVVHRSPYDGQVHGGEQYTGNGFWDTYRTVYPLLSLVWPERLAEVCRGWLTTYVEGGWLPRWASPGYQSCMVGNHLAAVFADAAARGIDGFDLELAYEAMKKDATVPGCEAGRFGRQGLEGYLERGYVADDLEIDSVSRTLDYAYNDWCCAQVAHRLGREDDAAVFDERAGNWRHVFDPQTRFMRPRLSDGSWLEPFDLYRWGKAYVEGGPWQYRLAVPHDPEGLAEALGGIESLVEAVEAMVAEPPIFRTGGYPREIHEMTELATLPDAAAAAGGFGQYAHSNQPVHGFLWLPARLGQPELTARLVGRVLDELYSPDAFCGDEDNGEQGAWYVLASLGRYAQCPGDGRWTMIPPTLSAEITPDDGDPLVVEAGRA